MTAAWGVLTTVMLLYVIEKTIGIRLTREEEQQGCDLVEHGIGEEDEEEEGGKEKVGTGAKTKEASASRRNTSTEVERFRSEGAKEPVERTFIEAFAMRLPIISRVLRRENRNTKSSNEEPNDVQSTNIESSADARKKDQASRTPNGSSSPRVASAQDVRRNNEDRRAPADLRSIYSLESDIEELLRREGDTTSETDYAKERTMDKCTQVTCEQGVLLEL